PSGPPPGGQQEPGTGNRGQERGWMRERVRQRPCSRAAQDGGSRAVRLVERGEQNATERNLLPDRDGHRGHPELRGEPWPGTPAGRRRQQQDSGKGSSAEQPLAEVRPAEPELFRPPASSQQTEGSSTGQQRQGLQATQPRGLQYQH